MRSTLSSCYFDANATYMGIGRLLQIETDPGRIAILEAAQRNFEHGHQALGRLMEEEPMPNGLLDFFRCLFGIENWRSRLPEQAVADRISTVEVESQLSEIIQPSKVAGPN